MPLDTEKFFKIRAQGFEASILKNRKERHRSSCYSNRIATLTALLARGLSRTKLKRSLRACLKHLAAPSKIHRHQACRRERAKVCRRERRVRPPIPSTDTLRPSYPAVVTGWGMQVLKASGFAGIVASGVAGWVWFLCLDSRGRRIACSDTGLIGRLHKQHAQLVQQVVD
jgi:hypothetical protein